MGKAPPQPLTANSESSSKSHLAASNDPWPMALDKQPWPPGAVPWGAFGFAPRARRSLAWPTSFSAQARRKAMSSSWRALASAMRAFSMFSGVLGVKGVVAMDMKDPKSQRNEKMLVVRQIHEKSRKGRAGRQMEKTTRSVLRVGSLQTRRTRGRHGVHRVFACRANPKRRRRLAWRALIQSGFGESGCQKNGPRQKECGVFRKAKKSALVFRAHRLWPQKLAAAARIVLLGIWNIGSPKMRGSRIARISNYTRAIFVPPQSFGKKKRKNRPLRKSITLFGRKRAPRAEKHVGRPGLI